MRVIQRAAAWAGAFLILALLVLVGAIGLAIEAMPAGRVGDAMRGGFRTACDRGFAGADALVLRWCYGGDESARARAEWWNWG